MGQVLAFFRRSRIDIDRVQSVWIEHIKSDESYFQKVITRICNQNSNIRSVMLPAANKQYATSEDEENFILSSIADRVTSHIHQIIMDYEILSNQKQLEKCFYDLGRHHSVYSKKTFKISYWEEFTMIMMEVLEEDYPLTSKEEQKAWHTFIRFLNEHMLNGYMDATSDKQLK